MPTFAAVDIGSNSCRLKIATVQMHRLKTLHEDREVTHEVGARGKCMLIDLGGGSCEVTLSDGGRIKTMVTMPLGAVRLQEEFLQSDPPAKEDVARLKQFIERELRRAKKKLGTPRVGLVVATSGTAAALAEASVAV